ncbi:hypothetical protein BDV27DRAFT_110235 [Aspergillus caelatus]|uniref:Transmembrane protein n=1 Tax=Aspergillus caelatus TaxID=61420 RepID=A0A5N7A533_9EURO|nr:uncharacterized protein BDV27DRAFT_110235 [Aspergillus caelatus]KAE8364795.1 hypothetical protein BDV27DRAFT_110235 [Aspergillus caelatus]
MRVTRCRSTLLIPSKTPQKKNDLQSSPDDLSFVSHEVAMVATFFLVLFLPLCFPCSFRALFGFSRTERSIKGTSTSTATRVKSTCPRSNQTRKKQS